MPKLRGLFRSDRVILVLSVVLTTACEIFRPLAKTEKVGCPVLPYEKGSVMKDTHDPRNLVRSTVLPTQPPPLTYYYHRNGTGIPERLAAKTEREQPSSHNKQIPNCSMASKLAPDIAINIDSNPYYIALAGVTKVGHVEDRAVMIDANLLQSKGQYNGLGVAAAAAAATSIAAHRKVGGIQYGMARMYS